MKVCGQNNIMLANGVNQVPQASIVVLASLSLNIATKVEPGMPYQRTSG